MSVRIYFPLFLLVLTCGVFASSSASAREKLLNIKEVTSPNGITAWLVEDHSVPVIAVEFAFRGAGTAYDPKGLQGLARMASNTMDEGAGSLDAQEFQKELRDLSLTLRFNAGRDQFGGSLKTLTKNKERGFELLNLALTKPRFDDEAIDRMRQSNQSRIRSSLSNPKWMAARILNDKVFEGHPYAMNSGGTLSSLDKVTAKELKAFHERAIGKNNLIVSVAGDITADELGAILDDVFGDLPTVDIKDLEPTSVQNAGSVFVYEHDVPQSVIEIMQPGMSRSHPDYHTAQVMNFVLGSSGFGSRLTEEIREKRGLTYGIYSYLYELNAMQGLAVSTSTASENVPEMLGLIKAEFEKMASTPISDSELSDAQSYLVGSLPLSLTSTNKITALMLSLQSDGLPIDYLDQREAAIKAVSIDAISRVAKDLLKPDQMTMVLVGKSGVEDAITVKDLPNVE
jgi:zinc protease